MLAAGGETNRTFLKVELNRIGIWSGSYLNEELELLMEEALTVITSVRTFQLQ